MPLVVGIGAFLTAAAPSPATIHERVASVLRSSRYQSKLPGEPTSLKFALPVDPILFLLRAMSVAAAIAVIVLAVAWLVRRLRADTGDVVLEPDGAAADLAAAIPLDAAQRLAAEGRFAEAIHALLMDTLEVLSRASRLAPALTSREIVQRVSLAPAARDALGGLVSAVEVSHFGRAPVGESDYRTCLARFRAFVASYRSAA